MGKFERECTHLFSPCMSLQAFDYTAGKRRVMGSANSVRIVPGSSALKARNPNVFSKRRLRVRLMRWQELDAVIGTLRTGKGKENSEAVEIPGGGN
jgi:hypothetical protein